MEKINKERVIEIFGQRALDALTAEMTNPEFVLVELSASDTLLGCDTDVGSFMWDPVSGEWDIVID